METEELHLKVKEAIGASAATDEEKAEAQAHWQGLVDSPCFPLVYLAIAHGALSTVQYQFKTVVAKPGNDP